MIVNSPMFLISERDLVDKRLEFWHEGIYYNTNTSINEDYMKPQKNIVRCKTFINLYTLSEDAEFFYFIGISQLDIKV